MDQMHNYIYWPVKIRDRSYHITLKYLGDQVPSPKRIIEALRGFKNLMPMIYTWKAEIFEHQGKKHYVLELVDFAPVITEMHEALNFRPDDFPTYRPHITLDAGDVADYKLWSEVRDGLTIHETEIFIGYPIAYLAGQNFRLSYLVKNTVPTPVQVSRMGARQ